MKRRFLAPVAVVVAALFPQAQAGANEAGTPARAHGGALADVDATSKRLRKRLVAVPKAGIAKLRFFQHASHSSHASHASHASHSSHVSGTGGPGIPPPSPSPSPPPPPPPPPADTTPPSVPSLSGSFAVDAGSVKGTVTAEGGSTLKVFMDLSHVLILTVPATGAPQEISFDVPEGGHSIYIVAVDAAGNESQPLTSEASYSRPSPPFLRILSGDETASLVLTIEGPVAGLAHLSLSNGQTLDVPLDYFGKGTARFQLTDGRYDINAVVSDRRGTLSAAATRTVVIDTAPPQLSLKVDKGAAKNGELRFVVRAERTSRVRVVARRAKLLKRYRAGSGPKTFKKSVHKGTYQVAVSATDQSGNQTTREATVAVR